MLSNEEVKALKMVERLKAENEHLKVENEELRETVLNLNAMLIALESGW